MTTSARVERQNQTTDDYYRYQQIHEYRSRYDCDRDEKQNPERGHHRDT
jgi:hypothetical protein